MIILKIRNHDHDSLKFRNPIENRRITSKNLLRLLSESGK